VGCSVADTVAG